VTHVTHFPYITRMTRARVTVIMRGRVTCVTSCFSWQGRGFYGLRIRRQLVILYARPALATRKRPPTLTSDNQITPKPNLALNAEIESSGRAANGTRNNWPARRSQLGKHRVINHGGQQRVAAACKKSWECWARRPGAGCGLNGHLALSYWYYCRYAGSALSG